VSAAVAAAALAVAAWWFGFRDAEPPADVGAPSPVDARGVGADADSTDGRGALESPPSDVAAKRVLSEELEARISHHGRSEGEIARGRASGWGEFARS
jgi:hypothetical protein